MKLIVAIDGPAGCGKSSVSKGLSKILNYIYVDTGAIYRSLAFLAKKHDIDPDDEENLLKIIDKIDIKIDEKNLCTNIVLENQILDKELRSLEISRLSSIVSHHEKVRKKLLDIQRNIALKVKDGAIFEGRDIGSIVFPYAPIKIFITANPNIRAKRRYEELLKENPLVKYDDVLLAISSRDERDQNRKHAPMEKAKDAFLIDTSLLSIKEVMEEALGLIKQTDTKNLDKKLW